jgi:protein-tyrosine-phosphatase
MCTFNAVRSPMAEALTKAWVGMRIYVQSAGVDAGTLDYRATEVLSEIGVDATGHNVRSLEQLHDGGFELVITLSEQACAVAEDWCKTESLAHEHWDIPNVFDGEGSRAQQLDRFRGVRDMLRTRIQQRFPSMREHGT